VKKVKWSRYRPGVAQRVCRVIALLFRDCGTRRGWVFSSTPWPHFTPGKDPMCGEYFMKIFKYFRHIYGCVTWELLFSSFVLLLYDYIVFLSLRSCSILQYDQAYIQRIFFLLIHLPHVCLFSNTFFIFCTHIIVSNRIAWGQRKQVFLKRNFLPQQVSLCYWTQ
jgi:hypothetical protein